ncbi:hypothetical protein DFP73DRAFT_547057 [Morchella snyderi]|nr:hypothetical protein DFP73DRAFT_547057 [Morchella snyderi]
MQLPTSLLLRSLPSIKRRSLPLLLPLRSLTTQPGPSAPSAPSAPTPETATETRINPRPLAPTAEHDAPPPEAPAQRNLVRTVISGWKKRKPSMTAPGHSALGNSVQGNLPFRRPEIGLKRHFTLEEHRLDRPEIETTWVDTHCHLFTALKMLKEASGDTTIPENGIDGFVKALFPPQVTAVVDIHCDLPLSTLHEHAVSLPWPAHFKYYFSKGVHPHCAADYTDQVHEALIAAMSHPSCVAWGECGLDYFKNEHDTHAGQRAVFARQLQAAVAAAKPIIIHTRSADEDTLRILHEHVPRDHRMHVHCFTAGPTLARALMAEWSNAYVGMTGVVGYKGMEQVTMLIESGEIPVGRMLLETDSPYMAPRGAYAWVLAQRPELGRQKKFHVSHSGMIPFTAEHVLGHVNAGRRKREEPEMGLVEILDVTRGNAARMYGIDV